MANNSETIADFGTKHDKGIVKMAAPTSTAASAAFSSAIPASSSVPSSTPTAYYSSRCDNLALLGFSMLDRWISVNLRLPGGTAKYSLQPIK